MQKVFIVISLVFGLLALGACGSDSHDNVAACEAYVNQINTLDCFGGAAMLNASSTCSAYDSTTCDISDYFDCLTTNTVCMDVGGMSVPSTSGTASCASMAECR